MTEKLEKGHTAIKNQTYEPSLEQQNRLKVLQGIVKEFEVVRGRYSIMGGYGLDGLYGALTRDHADIDMLLGTGFEDRGRDILFAMDIHKQLNKEIGAEVYIHSPTKTKVEIIDWGLASKFIEADESLFIPEETNAVLGGVAFRTATLQGHDMAHALQLRRAKEGRWGKYKHELHNANLKRMIEKKSQS